MTGGTVLPMKTLVLAGTAEARAVISVLASDPGFDVEASLAGATTTPAALPVPVHSGGFGGAAGLAAFCKDRQIGLILDVTHPFATVISGNAAAAAQEAAIPCLHYLRPAWQPQVGDRWRDFDSWQAMADAVPAGTSLFLAGGTQSVSVFSSRDDITLVARALNLGDVVTPEHATFIHALPSPTVESEVELLKQHDISLLCCKNSGGESSKAKIIAARECGIEVWMLARKPFGFAAPYEGDETEKTRPQQTSQKEMPMPAIHDSVEGIIDAARKCAAVSGAAAAMSSGAASIRETGA